jgi:HJR/Mrr/RecB family endonuclease
MHEPTLEEFDLTETQLQKAKVIDDRLPFVLFFISGIIFLLIAIFSGEFSFEPLKLFLGVLVWFGSSLLIMGILLIPSELIIRVLFPHYGRTKKYQKALNQYQEWWNRTQQDFWTSLSGIQFENELTKLFKNLGIRAEQTKASDDKGVDIWLHTDKGKEIVQCKAHKNPITPHVVRELYGTLKHFGAAQAILASTSGFTKGVFEFAKDKPIRLLDLNGIIAMHKKIGMEHKVII